MAAAQNRTLPATHLPTHQITHLFFLSPAAHLLTDPPPTANLSSTYLPIYLSIHLYTHLFIHPTTHPSTYSCSHPLIYIHSFIPLRVYPVFLAPTPQSVPYVTSMGSPGEILRGRGRDGEKLTSTLLFIFDQLRCRCTSDHMLATDHRGVNLRKSLPAGLGSRSFFCKTPVACMVSI